MILFFSKIGFWVCSIAFNMTALCLLCNNTTDFNMLYSSSVSPTGFERSNKDAMFQHTLVELTPSQWCGDSHKRCQRFPHFPWTFSFWGFHPGCHYKGIEIEKNIHSINYTHLDTKVTPPHCTYKYKSSNPISISDSDRAGFLFTSQSSFNIRNCNQSCEYCTQ